MCNICCTMSPHSSLVYKNNIEDLSNERHYITEGTELNVEKEELKK